MGKTSRRKGASYERTVAQLLELIWHEEFRRTPMSGGWAKKKITGDIVSVDRKTNNFPFSIECKNRKTLSIPAWLTQAIEDCPSAKIPLLFFHLPRDVEEYVCLKAKDFCYLVKDFVEKSKENPDNHDYKNDMFKAGVYSVLDEVPPKLKEKPDKKQIEKSLKKYKRALDGRQDGQT